MSKYVLLSLLLSFQLSFSQEVVINEIMASNQSTIYDEDGDTPDWIELYNKGTEQIDISGFGMSDDTSDTQKWKIENTLMEAGEHLLIFASNKDRDGNQLHTNFKINSSGETILLSDTSGTIIDQINMPSVNSDISFARQSDGSLSWIFQNPTPGATNTGSGFEGYADTVSVSIPGGFYSSTVSVVLSAGDSKIFYTLDSSDPDSNSNQYSSPIIIESTTVLKANSVKANYLPSPPIHHTYFINEDSDIPVVSLSTDPYNLFDYNYGIYADGPGWTPTPPHYGANYWMDWERPAHIEFYDEDKNLGFSENCGIAIHGGWPSSFAQKSFQVKFKKKYNTSAIEYPLFPDFEVTTFKSFLLRNSGNDFQYTHIRDAVMQALIKDLDVDYQEYRPAVTFLNGDYWGIYNIREKISEHYIASRHGVDPDNIDMLEGNMQVIHGDYLHYQQLIDYISTQDMTTDDAYKFIHSMIDVDECLLYFAAQVYFNSRDWPGNNIKYWRERSEKGKWRWIFFDLDFGFNLYEEKGQAEDHLYFILSGIETNYANAHWATLLPRKLVENPTLRNQFINQIADLLNTNFKSDRVIKIINEIADHIANDIDRHRERWGINKQQANYHLSTRMKSFAQERPGYLRGFVRDFFDSGDDGSITINATDGGRIKLNSLYFNKNDLPWSGVYFQGNPIHLKAIPDPGYKFDSWSGDMTSDDISLTLSVDKSTDLNASFSPDNRVAKKIVINEINYNASDLFETGDWIELYNRSDQDIDISNWVFSDNEEEHEYTFPLGTLLEADHYLVLVENEDAFTSLFPQVTNYIGEMGFGLDGTGEFIKLVDEEGCLIDSLTYDDEAPWPTESDGFGPTLELSDPASDNSKAQNWQASSGHGSPGKINTMLASLEETDNTTAPEKFQLLQNYPNPFNAETRIEYHLPQPSYVKLVLYDIRGQIVRELIKEIKPVGYHHLVWDGRDYSGQKVATGIYIYRIEIKSEEKQFVDLKKMVLMK